MSKEINYQEEIKNCKSVEDLVGKNGLVRLKDLNSSWAFVMI